MPNTARSCQEPATAASQPGMPPAYHQLYALLHTLRSLDAHNERICTLLTDIRRIGKLTAGTRRELTALIHDLPISALHAEADAVLSAVEQ